MAQKSPLAGQNREALPQWRARSGAIPFTRFIHAVNLRRAKEKRKGALLATQVGVDEAARQLQRPRSTVFGWWKQASELLTYQGNARSPTLKGQGCKEIFPSLPAGVAFMKDTRREENVIYCFYLFGLTLDSVSALSTHSMIEFMWVEEPDVQPTGEEQDRLSRL
jgi:transposase-like protein